MHPHNLKRKGFTLTEVIVVVTIIGILAAIAIPTYIGFINDTNIRSAKGTCELVSAAITSTHNRGLVITANDWDIIGITDPSDGTWTFTFPALAAGIQIPTDYAVTVTGPSGSRYSGKTGTFLVRASASSQWTAPH